ncbi:glycoside hydrolase family 38 C-terminal domain-containing protein (plasmid) [Photobacterium sp. DA100]|uniref:glycoside hydrolase family 38 N-terminal domain-containing protein n=1 Tax=Photobacterium sp. DA100 TaxID=3027472 RepID=UPI00247A0A7F|nr:glycoside hydrolase family 38 C-terminal domain-containing protein [Photobacterium sp. DA100]WEM44523.1 glycoside hydrolase family 38 C-terminal domain-containing protein [Photobacterium sp. DA100]
MQKVFHVIPHTHWDYEWYFSAHESLIQLVYHMEEVMSALETGANDTYLLDGQLSIVEDYLEQCPEQLERLRALVQQGKLIIGPWYTQTDQLIISGESIVRNLQTGIRLAEKLGPVMAIGYVPDAFGQSIDMPKIYQGVGIDKTVFWRGLSTEVCKSREFNWQCEDGSQVLGYNIKNGYFVGSHVMYSDDPTPLCHQAEEGSLAANIAIPLGGDQRFVDKALKSRLDISNGFNADYRLIESSYDKLFADLQAENLELPTISGELIDGQVSKIHRSIYSSRYDHKYLNDKVERRLSYQLEPLMVMAGGQGIEAKPALLNNIWKTIMRNHAHDSAGGCNTDKTNKIILSRFEEADQMSGSAVDYLVRKLAESQPTAEQGGIDGRVTLFNTLPYARNALIKTTVSTSASSFTLLDLEGRQIEVDVLSTKRVYRGSIQRDESMNDPSLYYYQSEVEFYYPLPASGHTSVQLVEQEGEAAAEAIASNQVMIENDGYRLSFEQGQFVLLDKVQNRVWENCINLIDMGDDGDTYDYSPPVNDWLIQLDWREATMKAVKRGLSESIVIDGVWSLPADLAERAKQQCSALLRYAICLRLQRAVSDCESVRPLTIEATFDNQVKDHRVQLLLTTPFEASTNWSDTPFGVVERENVPNQLQDWREQGWKEEPSPIYPMLHLANMHDQTCGLTVFTKGIKEYEVRANNQIALTLFRCVGWLGKPDLTRRPGIASGQQFKYIPTPDSQLLGELHCECALVIEENFEPARLQKGWQEYAIEPLVYQNQSLNQFTNTLKYFVMHPLPLQVEEHCRGIELIGSKLVVSAIKPTEDGSGTLVRLYNPSSEVVTGDGYIQTSAAQTTVTEVNLLEQPVANAQSFNGQFELGLFKPKQIRSFVLK